MAYYITSFIISVVCTIVYLYKFKSSHESIMNYMFVIVTLTNMGYLIRGYASTVEGAGIGNILTYLAGCFLQTTIMFLAMSLCRIRCSKVISTFLIVLGFAMYLMILTDSYTHIFYKGMWIEKWNDVTVLNKVYGVGHSIFYIYLLTMLFANIGILIFGALKKKEASIKNIMAIMIAEFICVCVYFFQKFFPSGIELTVVVYNLFLIILLLTMDRISLYSVGNTVARALVDSTDMGCFTFSKDRSYIGADDSAKEWFPELLELRVDTYISNYKSIPLIQDIEKWMDAIDADGESVQNIKDVGDKKYMILGSHIIEKGKKRGYQFTISDYTNEQKYVDLIKNYNTNLKKEVKEKTAHIIEMHDRLVFGMAAMVEGRDKSTGGHIKRTSAVVAILIDSMKKDNSFNLSEEFCEAVVKAAPMHDLGKITVDDAVLRKPGRFTPEEFDMMKTHAANGAEIVKKLLDHFDNAYFAQIAENVAHYHHERVDGSGYPCGLKGNEIPLEARIMAIADVYDALVSKRCYKDSLSFEKAYEIIEEGMGTQFDERLNKYFVASRDKLEEFYKTQIE